MASTNQLLIKKYFEEHSFIESSIASFNKFIDIELQKTVDEIGDIIPTILPPDVQEFTIKFNKIWIEKPQITEADGSKRNIFPIEARMRKLTYAAPMYLEVSAFIDGIQRESFISQIGKIPIMLRSKYCHLHKLSEEELIEHGEDPTDPGGYFIINGNERIIITVEDLLPNKVFFQYSKTGPSKHTAKIFSQRGPYSIPHVIEQMKDGIFYLSFTKFKRIPLVTVIKSLGLTKDKEIMDAICDEKEYDDVYINLYNSAEIKNTDDAIEFIAKKIGLTQPREIKIEKTTEQLDHYLLPHIGITSKERINKAYHLCKLTKKFLQVSIDKKANTDKDHYKNKKLKLPGDLLADLFRVNMRVLVNDILYNFQRLVKRGKFQSVKIIIRDKLLTSRLKSAIATGAWVGGRRGISQNIARVNYLDTMSHLGRVVSLLSATQENFEAREIHSTHWGRLCLKKDTNVLLADTYSQRSLESLQNCWNHQKVSTFDIQKNNLRPSAIAKYYTSNPKLMNKKVYKFISESGREIVATEDHPFYTKKGWLDGKHLSLGEYVAVYPTLQPLKQPELPTKELGFTIVDKKDIISLAPHRHKHYMKELHTRELLPLTVNNYKIEIIARLLGHLFSDGHCGKYNLEFYCGSEEDAKTIARDISLLGFEASKIRKKHSQITFNGRITNYTTYTLTKGGALHTLLVAAGAPVGKKTDTKVEVPYWIKKTETSVKREFLAALLGGDGPKPRAQKRSERKSGSKVKIDSLLFHKNAIVKESGIQFSHSLKELFEEFDVDVIKMKVKEDYVRKDGSLMFKIELVFGKSQSNIQNILTKIGYRYCQEKEIQANTIGEWLRIRENAINERNSLKEKVQKLYNEGMTPKQITKILGINYRTTQAWIFEKERYKETRLTQRMLPTYQEWFAKVKIGDTGAVFEKIISKEKEDLDDVRDFTTVEDTHSFIANGFITHNCPIETPEGTPIGLRKNQALLCQVTQEEVAEDKLKRSLENLGVRLVK